MFQVRVGPPRSATGSRPQERWVSNRCPPPHALRGRGHPHRRRSRRSEHAGHTACRTQGLAAQDVVRTDADGPAPDRDDRKRAAARRHRPDDLPPTPRFETASHTDCGCLPAAPPRPIGRRVGAERTGSVRRAAPSRHGRATAPYGDGGPARRGIMSVVAGACRAALPPCALHGSSADVPPLVVSAPHPRFPAASWDLSPPGAARW